MNKLRNAILVLAITLSAGLLVPASAFAANALDAQCTNNADLDICKDAKKDATAPALIKNIINTLLFVVGAVSVVMIIVGGILYTTSAGDAGRVTKAKNTIMYAVVGLVVAFVAFAVVQFVVSRFNP